MKSIVLIFFLIFLLTLNSTRAQTNHYFIDATKLDTISDFNLTVFRKSEKTNYKPEKNKSVKLDRKKIKKADSIILKYDSWYVEKIPKEEFSFNNIYVNKQLYLEEVHLITNTKTLGTSNRRLNGLIPRKNSGELVAFPLENIYKINNFKLFINKMTVENSQFIPVFFMADSINDPQRIHLYPEGKILTINEKLRKDWLTIPIEQYYGPFKSNIYAGYIAMNSNIIFGTAKARKNDFLDSYYCSLNSVHNPGWTNEYVYRIEDYSIVAVKIDLDVKQ